MLKIKESLKDTKSHNNEKLNLFNSRGGRGKDAFKYLCFTFYWSLSSFADIHLDFYRCWMQEHLMFNETNNKI